MPSRSSAISAVSAASPGTAKQVVLGRRWAPSPNTTVSGRMARRPASRRCCRRAAAAGEASGLRRGRLEGSGETGDAGDVLGPRALAALLPAAADQRLGLHALADQHDGADALGSAELVAGQDQHVGADRLGIARRAAGELHGIADEHRTGGMRQLGDAPGRLQHAGLVVGGLHGDHDAGLAVTARQVGKRGSAGRRDRSCRRHRRRASRRARPGSGGPAARRRARLRRPAGRRWPPCRHDARMLGVSTQAAPSVAPEVKNTSAGRTRSRRAMASRASSISGARLAALGMHRGRIADQVERGQHGLARLGPQRRRRVPVEICTPAAHSVLTWIDRWQSRAPPAWRPGCRRSPPAG